MQDRVSLLLRWGITPGRPDAACFFAFGAPIFFAGSGASEHPFLKPFYSKFESDNVCFDCTLLLADLSANLIVLLPFGARLVPTQLNTTSGAAHL